jgi:hypothetical protein
MAAMAAAKPAGAVEKLLRIPESLSCSLSQTKADYRTLGRSGLRVSNPILGGLHLGSSKWLPWVLEEDKVSCGLITMDSKYILTEYFHLQALPLLKAAYDRGINTVCIIIPSKADLMCVVGHGQCLLKWAVRENHGKSNPKVQDPSKQGGDYDKVLSSYL